MILGITGRMAAGKSTVADALVARHGFVAVSLADEMKRCTASIYDFTEEQLWGPSEKRNAPDKRYPRSHSWKDLGGGDRRCLCCGLTWEFDEPYGEPQCYLTPRYALQLLGTEYGRHCFEDTWVRRTLDVVGPIVEFNGDYDKVTGLCEPAAFRIKGVVIPDLRYDNEAKAIHAAGGWIVKKTGGPSDDAAVTHTSEAGIDSSLIDFTLSWWENPADAGRDVEIKTMLEQLKGKRT